ncbi:hypothetical protein BKA62DRAFT_681552 [Auriculariales sp. MPI-PUGE-AT-0066]|nr:hypothetical protein BKA62DRAFT_681552 [Auriculariales sp. MPI-PUGE-AT-0066]
MSTASNEHDPTVSSDPSLTWGSSSGRHSTSVPTTEFSLYTPKWKATQTHMRHLTTTACAPKQLTREMHSVGRLGVPESKPSSFTVTPPFLQNTKAHSSDEVHSMMTNTTANLYAHSNSSSSNLYRHPYRYGATPQPHSSGLYSTGSPPKRRLPFTESLSSLRDIFRGKSKDKDDIGCGPYIPLHRKELQRDFPGQSNKLNRTLNLETGARYDFAHGGELFYHRADLVPPRWQRCQASLYAAQLSLSWSSPTEGGTCLFLSDCTNIRSLPARALVAPLAPPVEENESAHAFAVEFGERVEMFATTSVTDRVVWVTGIWDGLIGCRRGSSAAASTSTQNDASGSVADPADLVPLHVVNSDVSDASPEAVKPSASYHPRSLSQRTETNSTLESLPASIVQRRVAAIEERSGSTSTSTFSQASQQSDLHLKATAKAMHSPMLEADEQAFFHLQQSLDSAFGSYRSQSPPESGPPPVQLTRTYESSMEIFPVVTPPPIEKDDVFQDHVTFAVRQLPVIDTDTDSQSLLSPALEQSTMDLRPLYALLNRQSTVQFSSTKQMQTQLKGIRSDIGRILLDVNAAMKSRHTEPRLDRVEAQLNDVLRNLSNLNTPQRQGELDQPTAPVKHSNTPRRDHPLPPIQDLTPVISSLEELKKNTLPQPLVDFTPILDKLEAANVVQRNHHELLIQKFEDLQPVVAVDATNADTGPAASDREPLDDVRQSIADILAHMQNLKAQPSAQAQESATRLGDEPSRKPAPNSSTPAVLPGAMHDEGHPKPSDVETLLTRLQTVHAILTLVEKRGVETRNFQEGASNYLGDLNKWMEEYTTIAGTRIEAMGADVQRLCAELGLSLPNNTAQPAAPHNSSGANGPATPAPGLLESLRLFLAEQPSRSQDMALLRQAVDSLGNSVSQKLLLAQDEPKRGADDYIQPALMEHQQATGALLQSILDQHLRRNEVTMRDIVQGTLEDSDIIANSTFFFSELTVGIKQDITSHVRQVQREVVDFHLAEMRQQVGAMHAEAMNLSRQHHMYLSQIKDMAATIASLGQNLPQAALSHVSQPGGASASPSFHSGAGLAAQLSSPRRQAHRTSQQEQQTGAIKGKVPSPRR